MTALIQRLRKEEKGLTLIELLAVIVIIGVIAAIAIPLIGGLISDTKDNARTATANQLFEAAKLYSIANNNGELKNPSTGAITLQQLEDDSYIQKGLTDPKEGTALDKTNTLVNLDNYNAGSGNVVTLVFADGNTLAFTASDLKDSTKGTSGSTTPPETK
ncbi:prepilin-type N-terminal cleavage/methylation domain-containing protein [Paenibacillus sp. FSL R5-0407]|uniref:prepilin-type N-terminal cleavage/methylation domain-containing protein n=1 Tax=Paenibacillus TaxID=44249 RepID=UPI0025B6A1A2|nr:prepilin-type N-terminal cleavage/methylation domain-containing protein [Paenibacillus vini]MDN4069601.1 prepilin-type N-terminal cleavage/methylation domain-containing protein [Paenibacillus vini]